VVDSRRISDTPLIHRRTIYLQHSTHTIGKDVRAITKQSQSNVAGDPYKSSFLCDISVIRRGV
jgi:hypothetical protein